MTGLHFTGCHIPACSPLSSRVHRLKDDKLTAHHTGYQASNDILQVLGVNVQVSVCMCICICMTVWKRESCHFWCFSQYPGLPVYGKVLEGRYFFFYAQHPTCQPHRLLWRRIEGDVFLLSDMFIKHFHSKPVQLCYSTDYIWFKCFPTWSHHDFFQDRSSGEMLPHQQWTEI